MKPVSGSGRVRAVRAVRVVQVVHVDMVSAVSYGRLLPEPPPEHQPEPQPDPSEGPTRMRIAVVALGKIGLPLAVQYTDKGHEVIGVDVNLLHSMLYSSGSRAENKDTENPIL